MLAQWCSREGERLQGKNVLELGAGLGLMGISAIHMCQPASYIMTDLNETVLKTLCENVVNNLSCKSQDRIDDAATLSLGSEQEVILHYNLELLRGMIVCTMECIMG